MKKCISLAISIVMLILLCFSSMVTASAESAELQKESSLTLVYKQDEIAYEGLDIQIYRVAGVKNDYSFHLVDAFAKYPVNIYDVKSQAEWRNITETLTAYTVADAIMPTATGKTDATGTVKFEELLPGMYLTLGVRYESEGEIVIFENFLTVIPRQTENAANGYDYDVTAYPKCEKFVPTPDEITYKVVKQWKDGGNSGTRTKSVKIDIFKDGVLAETVTLSADNNWMYSWKAPNDGADWTTVERDIPKDYTVNVTEEGTTFIVTNIYDHITDSPQTGDTTNIALYVILMCASGMALIILGFGKKRREV